MAAGEGPELLDGPKGGVADDLKLIKGVGPGIEKKLHDAGVYHYDQIAQWTDADIAVMDDKLSFRGRIKRDDWITQARQLASGRTNGILETGVLIGALRREQEEVRPGARDEHG